MGSLSFDDHRTHTDTVVNAVLNAADPRQHTARALRDFKPLPDSVRLVAFGKASVAMTIGAADVLGDRIRFGIALAPPTLAFRPEAWPAPVGLMPADHPLPSERNFEAARVIEYIARDCAISARAGQGETLVALVSGGGSAHLSAPAGDVTVEDLRRITLALQTAGANIQEINTLRRHCETLKGGRLAALANPAPVLGFILSDVVGDEPAAIASGPLSADPTSFDDALRVLDKFKLRNSVPRVTAYLEDHRDDPKAETIKPGDALLASTQTRVIASNRAAVKAAEEAVRTVGFRTILCREKVTGEARDVGKALARQAIDIKKQSAARADGAPQLPAAIILGGETTVTVKGKGVGGRNQELALAAAIELDGHPDIALLTFSTDGVDGPTDAAGVLISGATCTHTHLLGLNARAALDDNDSHTFFARLEAGGHPVTLYRTGPTGTNVNDIAVALIY